MMAVDRWRSLLVSGEKVLLADGLGTVSATALAPDSDVDETISPEDGADGIWEHVGSSKAAEVILQYRVTYSDAVLTNKRPPRDGYSGWQAISERLAFDDSLNLIAEQAARFLVDYPKRPVSREELRRLEALGANQR